MADYEARGRIDLRRESDLYRDRILQQRSDINRYPGTTAREDLPDEFARREVVSNLPEVSRLTKVALVAGSAYVAGRMIGRENLIKLLSGAGELGYSVKNRVVTPARSFFLDTILGFEKSSTSIARNFLGASSPNYSRVAPDLVQEIEKIYSKYGNLKGGLSLLHGPNGTGIDLHRGYLADKYKSSVLPSGFRSLTVSDLLNNNSIRNQFSQNTISVLKKANLEGLVSPSFSISREGSFGFFTKGDKVLDTQWASPLRVFDAAHNFFRKFKIGSLSPADLVFGAIRPLITHGEHASIGNKVPLPNGIRTGSYLNFALGQDIYSYVDKSNSFQKIASGMRIYDISSPGSHFYGRAVANLQGRVTRSMEKGLERRLVGPDENLFKFLSQSAQRMVGFGREYATNRSALGQIIDVFKRREIDTGRGVGEFVKGPYVPRSSSLSYLDRLQAEAAFRKGNVPGYSSLEEYLDEAIPNPSYKLDGYANMSFTEKIKALFGSSRVGSHYSVPPSEGFSGEKIGDVLNPRTPLQGFTPGANKFLAGPGGKLTDMIPASGIADLPGAFNSVNLFMHHATERLNQLFGTTMGWGFRPTPGRFGWAGNLLKIYGIAHTLKAGLEYAKYADYLSGKLLSAFPGLDDTTPSEYAVSAYAGAMVARQKLREATGIQPLAQYMEGLMPGSWSLPGMTAIRTVGPVIAGAYKHGKVGALAGLGASFLFGGKDVQMSSEELRDIYSGKKNIPVMKSRWWVLGTQSYGGDKIEYWRQHWVARYLGNARYTDVQYGSKAEYFSYDSSALTPHNLFGLKNLLNPDHYSMKHMYDRPYPYSASGKRMHENEEILPPGNPMSPYASGLGYEASPGTYYLGTNPTSLISTIRRKVNAATELGGVYKFFAEQIPFYEDVFGTKRSSDIYAADASNITSKSREFYDESLGGMLGMTELLRRFLDPDHGREGINYIPNQMPSWLPGARSEFKNDQDYYTDFTLGDPYSKIAMGEIRLPGQGYERMHQLHSGTPGVYDAVDRLMVLSDVAPYSQAYRNYKTIVDSWILGGAIDKSWKEKILQRIKETDEILDGPEYTPRIFSGIRSGNLDELARVNQYSAPERAIGAAWETVTHDVVPSIGRVVPIWGTIFDRKLFGQRSAYESYLEDQVYGTDFHNWETPYSSFIRPRIQNLAASDPLTATLGGAGLGVLFGNTPTGFITGAIGAAGLGTFSAARTFMTGQTRGGWIPGSFSDRNNEEQYFDALMYERGTRNKELALSLGRQDIAGKMGREALRTNTGTNYMLPDEIFMRSARFKLGYSMKNYASQFLYAPEETRKNILQYASPMANPILQSAWARQGDTRFNRKPNISARYRANNSIAMYGMPSNDWAGWSPDIPIEAIKIRTLDSVHNFAYDMHKYNLWEADKLETDRSYPTLGSAY